ncbi:hypothetical protein KY284_016238 [Solanum tuberosum]|nr:hypothetical protein KY284_016238 [Solanum tuberosum]
MAAEIWEVLTRLDRMAIDMANVATRQNQLESVNEKSFLEPTKAIEDGHGKRPATPRFSEEIYSPTSGPLGIPEQFFSFDEVQSEQKVTIAALYFDDLALQWHQAYMRSRLGAEFDDPMSELVSLRQTGSVISYQVVLDRAMTRLTLDPNHAIIVFLNGLKPELGDAWRETMKNQPYSYAKPQTTPNLHLPKPPPPIVAERPRRRRLNPVELSDKRAKRLCYICDEKYEQGHLPEVVESCEISIHAMTGIKGYRTLRLTGHCHKKALNILIDTGSTHNFMGSGLVARMGWKVSPCNWGDASLAAGNYVPISGMCHGVEWLLQVSSGQISFFYPLEEIQLFMIKVTPKEEKFTQDSKPTPLVEVPGEVQQVLHEFTSVFGEPKGLPPSRGSFDHHIPLKEGSNPVNARPYRYSPVQKDVIENMVKELKDQGLIRHSCSPFASPVSLVGKKDGNWRLCRLQGFESDYYQRQIPYSYY